MNRLYALISICLLFSSFVLAQSEMNIQGTVYDTSGARPLKNAVAVAIRVKDSLLLGYQRTDAEGKFELKGLPVDTFSVVISHRDFDDKTYYFFGNPQNRDITIPAIVMAYKSSELDEVVIYAYKDPIYFKGDTLVYIADSFQVAEHAVVEDLLKKLPGLEIDRDGKIKSQGKEISQVLVDGDEFFGSDPTIATKNLGAKGVQTVEVYEKKRQNGADGEETIQVLDLKLKEDAKKGYFGRISGASDFQQFYESELLVNKFNRSQKISVFVLAANTPKSDFGFGDRRKFGLENEGRNNRFDNDGIFIDFNNNQDVGVPRTLKAGVYYSDKYGKKKNHTLGFNYSYYNTNLTAVSQSRSQYFIQDSTFFTDDSTRNVSFDDKHRINFRYEGQLDSLTKLEIRPQITLSTANQDYKDYSAFRDANNNLQRFNSVFNDNRSEGQAFNNETRLQRDFKKKRRQLNLRHVYDYSDDLAEGTLISTNEIGDTSFTLDQLKLSERVNQSHDAYATYYEPFGEKYKVQFDYNYQYGFSNQDRETRTDYDPATGRYETVDSTFTNNFDNLRISNRAGIALWRETRKHTLHGGVRLRNVLIDNTNLIDRSTIHQDVTNWLPNFTYRFRPNQSKNLVIRYNTNSALPSITDLQPVPDNTNPNRIQRGNPNVRPNYEHKFDLSFNTFNALKGRFIYAGMSGQVTQNAFGDSTTFNFNGIQTVQTVNVDGNFYLVGYAGGGFPFFNRKLMLRPNLSYFHSQNTSFVNTEKNTGITRNLNASVDYALDFDSLEITLRNTYSLNSPTNSVATFNTQPFASQSYFAGITWRLPKGFKIETNANYTLNTQRSDGYNINFLIWNAAFTKYFLKTQNLEVTALMNDILNQNISANRFVSQNVVTDNFTRIISRYFLLKVTLRFNNNKTKEQDEQGWF